MHATQTHRVIFATLAQALQVPSGARIMDAVRQAGIDIMAGCGGRSRCGRCRVIVRSGHATPPQGSELQLLSEGEIAGGMRLACCAGVLSDLEIELPATSRVRDSRLQLGSDIQAAQLDPAVCAWEIAVNAPTLANPSSDHARVAAALARELQQELAPADLAVLTQLPAMLRQHAGQLSAFVRGTELVGTAAPQTRPLGLAVDLGTTKIAAALLDLSDGRELAAAGRINPQARYGDDLMSRMHHATRHPLDHELTTLVRTALNELVGEMTAQVGAAAEQVADACIVANTAMSHLLLGLPVTQLALSPYVAASSLAIDVKVRELGLKLAPGAYVHVPPSIGGFVGADHVAMMLALEVDRLEHTAIALDIGTNTEIVLRRPDLPHLFSVSCASGPAFEGAHVSNGMKAASGAIEALRLSRTEVHVDTIDEAPAIGLCGSGIVDALAELHRWGLINFRGRLDPKNPRVRRGPFGPEFVLVPAKRSGSGQDIVLKQKDIEQIQLAKGAIRAGIEALLEVTGTDPESVHEIYLAGAFGSYLNLQGAIQIGLLPLWPQCAVKQVGNAAAVGAKQMLLSRRARQRARQMAAATRYVELATHPGFNRTFARAMLFSSTAQINPAADEHVRGGEKR